MLFKKIALNQVKNPRSEKPGLNYDQIKIVAQSILNSGYPVDVKNAVLAALFDRHRMLLGKFQDDNKTKLIPPGRSGLMEEIIKWIGDVADQDKDGFDQKIFDGSKLFSEALLPANQVKRWVVKALTNPINPMPDVPLMTRSEAINFFCAVDYYQISGANDWVTDLYGHFWSRKPTDYLVDLMNDIAEEPSQSFERKSLELTDTISRRDYVLTQIQSGEIKPHDLLWLFASFRDVLKGDIDPITLQLASKCKKLDQFQPLIYFLYASVRDQLSPEEAALKRAKTIQSSALIPGQKGAILKSIYKATGHHLSADDVLNEYDQMLNATTLNRQEKIEGFNGLFQAVGKKLTTESVGVIRSHILSMNDSDAIIYEGLRALYQNAAHCLSPTHLVCERDTILTATQLNGDCPKTYQEPASGQIFFAEPEITGHLQSSKKCSVITSMYRQSADGLSDTDRHHHVTSILQSANLNLSDKRSVLKSIYDTICTTWTGVQIAGETDFILGQSGIDESVMLAIYVNGDKALSSGQAQHEIKKILESTCLDFNPKGIIVNRLFPWSVRDASPEQLTSESERLFTLTQVPSTTVVNCLKKLYLPGAANLTGGQISSEREKILQSNLRIDVKRDTIEVLYKNADAVVLGNIVQTERIAILDSNLDDNQSNRTHTSGVLKVLYQATNQHLSAAKIETEINAISNSGLDAFEQSTVLAWLEPGEYQSIPEMIWNTCSVS